MNEFTKEELIDLCYAARVMHKSGYDYPSEKPTVHLYTKIQSLIDNYCEHESDGSLYTRLGPAPYLMSLLKKDEFHLFKNNKTKCIKCGIYYQS